MSFWVALLSWWHFSKNIKYFLFRNSNWPVVLSVNFDLELESKFQEDCNSYPLLSELSPW